MAILQWETRNTKHKVSVFIFFYLCFFFTYLPLLFFRNGRLYSIAALILPVTALRLNYDITASVMTYFLIPNKYAWYKKIASDNNDIFAAETDHCICVTDLCDRVISYIY